MTIHSVVPPNSIIPRALVIPQGSVIPAKAGTHLGTRIDFGRIVRRVFRRVSTTASDRPRLGGRGDEGLSGGIS